MKIAEEHDVMRPQYDFSKGVRGKHHKAYQQGTNVVLLEPEHSTVKAGCADNHSETPQIRCAGQATSEIVSQPGR